MLHQLTGMGGYPVPGDVGRRSAGNPLTLTDTTGDTGRTRKYTTINGEIQPFIKVIPVNRPRFNVNVEVGVGVNKRGQPWKDMITGEGGHGTDFQLPADA